MHKHPRFFYVDDADRTLKAVDRTFRSRDKIEKAVDRILESKDST